MLESKALDQSERDSNPIAGQVKGMQVDFSGPTPTLTESEVDLTVGAEALLLHRSNRRSLRAARITRKTEGQES
jgi:hypothetical protein